MTITDEQLKGNWAEQYIAANLASHGCFIRHVTQGHDSGIDLYCETLKENIPFLHFWCQVKTSKNWKGKRKQLSFKPEKKQHEDYWLKQPVPVFIFLVPDLRDKLNIPYYICRAFDLLSNEKIKSFLKIELPKDLSTFLNEDLVSETHLWELKNGKVSSLKTPKREYTIQYPKDNVHKFEKRLFKNMHTTLWRLSEDILFRDINKMDILEKTDLNNDENERFRKAKPYMHALKILIKSKHDEHYQNYLTIGHCYELEKEHEESLNYYKESWSIINRDPNVDVSEHPWKDIIDEIHQHMERVKSKM
jgi:hypothetical protein